MDLAYVRPDFEVLISSARVYYICTANKYLLVCIYDIQGFFSCFVGLISLQWHLEISIKSFLSLSIAATRNLSLSRGLRKDVIVSG